MSAYIIVKEGTSESNERSKYVIIMKRMSECNEGSQGLDCIVAVEFRQN